MWSRLAIFLARQKVPYVCWSTLWLSVGKEKEIWTPFETKSLWQPPPNLVNLKESWECQIPMRIKYYSAPKQILTAVAQNLVKWEEHSVGLQPFLGTLWWKKVSQRHVSWPLRCMVGIISWKTWVTSIFHWAEACQRFCTRWQAVPTLVSPSEANPNPTDGETSELVYTQWELPLPHNKKIDSPLVLFARFGS